jgi:MFS family permease
VRDPDSVGADPLTPAGGRAFAWAVFFLSFALLLADFMSRNVLVPALPLLQQEWALSDTQLGALTGAVALVVAVLAVPLSLVGDRIGRVRAVQGMALLWSLATVACALAENYGQLFAARVLLGVGEAAYGSVGLAVVLAVFPPDRRASLTGAFLAGASLGAVLGVALGGILTARFGWRWSFGVMALLGLVLTVLHRLLVSDGKVARCASLLPADGTPEPVGVPRARLTALVHSRPLVCAYLASGLQLFAAGALITWLPTYLARVHGLPTAQAALVAAAVILGMSLGMVGCGWATDRLSRFRPARRWTTSVVYSLASLVFLGIAFALGPGRAQLALLAVGGFFVAGPAGAAGALVTSLTPESIRATALGTLALANNLLGLAAGPIVVGVLADRIGLAGAMRLAPLMSVAAIVVLLIGRILDTRASRPVAWLDGSELRPGGRTVRRG